MKVGFWSGLVLLILFPWTLWGQESVPAVCEGVVIDRVDVSGGLLLRKTQQEALVAPYEQRCIQADDIEDLLGALTQHYLDRGFSTTRVYLPEQDLTTGVLKLLVVEGRIAAIEVTDDPEGHVNANSATAARVGDRLNARDLEQAVEQINSAPGNSVKLDIVPGEEAGESTVVFRNTPGAWWKGSVSANNHADADAWQGSFSLSAGSLLGLNDTGTLTYNQFEKDTKSQSHSLSWAFPLGYTTYSLNYSQSAYETPLNPSSGNSLTSSGNTLGLTLAVDRVLSRYQTATHTLKTSYAYSDARNYLNEELLLVSSKVTRTVSVGVSSELKEFYGASLTVSPQVALGVTAQDNLPGVSEDSEGPQSQYTLYSLNLNYKLPFSFAGEELSWTSIYQTQYTREPVGSRISIGGLGSVRGFESTSVSGDLGYYWQNEVTWETSLEVGGVALTEKLLAALDMGHVYSVVPGSGEGTLRGWALGATTSALGAELALIWTTPQYLSEGLPSDNPRLWATLSYNF